MPLPRALDDLFEFGEFRFPAKDLARLSRIADKLRRVARPSRRIDRLDRLSGDAAGGFYHFLNGIAAAVAKVNKLRSAAPP